jgi:hypothetical protein
MSLMIVSRARVYLKLGPTADELKSQRSSSAAGDSGVEQDLVDEVFWKIK